jgi:zinc protease
MLAGVLDGGYSARIETEIVRNQQIATTAGAQYSGFTRGNTLFMLSGRPSARFTTDDVEKAFDRQISRLQTELAKPEELERIKAQVISGIIYQQDSLPSQANQIGHLESIGRSWEEGISLAENLKKITPEQIQAVAKKYLISKRKNVATLVPQTIQAPPPISG